MSESGGRAESSGVHRLRWESPALSERRERLDPPGWKQELSVKVETPTDYDVVSRRASFDPSEDGVVVEHESGEQMRATCHLRKMAIAHRGANVISMCRTATAGVLVIPSDVDSVALGSTENGV
ncbi:hypothetical protein [Halorientalis halophila]|uniref:hypothetical protein n=1 Tax=Halorientalis halophila TaxID=3108499 RepID=UPI00300B41F6